MAEAHWEAEVAKVDDLEVLILSRKARESGKDDIANWDSDNDKEEEEESSDESNSDESEEEEESKSVDEEMQDDSKPNPRFPKYGKVRQG